MYSDAKLNQTYRSQRNAVLAKNGMVCTSHHLAAQVGRDILKKGGNAIDAAIATAICMTLMEPGSCGIGGDAFALIWTRDKELLGLNASGPAPQLIDPDALRAQGLTVVPELGWLPVTVPGAPSAWAALSDRLGRLPLEELFEPTIHYAREGYPVPQVHSLYWELAAERFRSAGDPLFDEWFRVFTREGRCPGAGELFICPELADSLQELSDTHCESLYRGALAEKIDAHSRATGGYLRREDLSSYAPEWVTPISTSYRGYEVWELPPNPQGILAQMALNIMEGFSLRERDCAETYHRQIEALKLAFVDAEKHVGDPRYMKLSTEELLSKDYAASRRALIGDRASLPEPGNPRAGGTIYLCTADSEGNMVSYIQSVYKLWGSGVTIPGTGISLQCRGYLSPLDRNEVNCFLGGKKPRHTIIPGFLTRNGEACGPFGVMGGFMQPQGHLQMVMNLLDFDLNPQEALDAPRWEWIGGKTVRLETITSPKLIADLAAMGHDVLVCPDSHEPFGKGQIIMRTPEGMLLGGTEPRTDGACCAW